jgi:hypothetical protein
MKKQTRRQQTKIWHCKPLLLDFDGVVHGYPEGHPFGFDLKDPMVPGAAQFITEAHDFFDVSIYSARSIDTISRELMKAYLRRNGVDPDRLGWPIYKPAAWLTIDDRCLRFDGRFPKAADLLQFKAWCE